MTITNTGYTLISAAMTNTGAQPAPVKYMALTTDATAPAATDTVLTSEIATAGGGLIRAAIGSITYSGTGNKVSTLVQTFTVNVNDTGLPVTIAKFGCFNASSAGTMAFEFKFAAAAVLSAIGDSVAVTEVVTLT